MRFRIGRPLTRAALASLAVLTVGGPALAQEAEWRFLGSFYIYGAETTTRIGANESELSFRDALDNLDLAFMATLEARHGRWAIIADYMRTALSFTGDTPGPVFSGAKTSLDTQFLSGYLAYTAYQTPALAIDLGAGFRWFETNSKVTLTGGPGTNPSTSTNESWVDGLIAARARWQINERWSASALADYGGFSSDSETMQVLATAGYALNDHWTLRGGYRYIKVSEDIDGTRFELSQSGPMLGITYEF